VDGPICHSGVGVLLVCRGFRAKWNGRARAVNR
jgi:hypothetical protein